ncbi:MAG: type II toxin-antitoxin system RelE/ParE family toxin [Alphaproteobacteria bacterium]|nr:type II toxin-antitoxin system RelE/ParE family toxin [Alphaproteobacteria bacterium]
MHYAVAFSKRAEKQLDNLYVYIADNSGVARAEDFVGGIVADCLSLETFPERGTKRDDIHPLLRIKSYARRVTIAFSVDHDGLTVMIHGIFYGGQDFERLLHGIDSDR